MTKKKQHARTASKLPQDDLQVLAKVKWNSLQTDLKSALGTWNDVNLEETNKSPDEEQFNKVKTLIEDLKLKLSDF